jgi:DNA-binding IclR family transcriptional regulator
VRLISDLGSRLPAHCCALGKALLASLSDDEVLKVLPKQLSAVTSHTITRRPELLDALAAIRRSGLAHEREEVTAGLTCFAAFVGVTALGKRVAVSTSLPLERIDARREKRIAIAVVEMAHRIGKTLCASAIR